MNNRVLMIVFSAVLVFLGLYYFEKSYDNDIWFILASGREIVENGIPYVNPWAIHEDMSIVIQQWLPDVIAWLIYSAAGFAGLGVWMAAMVAILMFFLYKLGRLMRGNDSGGEVLLFILFLAVPCLGAYLSMRPHYYSMIAFTAILWCMEKYRRTDRYYWLAIVVGVVLLHGNFHMAMAPFDLVIIFCYLIPDLLSPFHKRGHIKSFNLVRSSYKRIPVLITLVASAAVLLVNPYGINGALYLFLSYGAANYSNFIKEMKPTSITTAYGAAGVVMVVLGVLSLSWLAIKKRLDLPITILFIGCAIFGFTKTRNVWYIAMFAYPLIAEGSYLVKFVLPEKWKRKHHYKTRHLPNYALGIAAVVLFAFAGVSMAYLAPHIDDEITDSKAIPIGALDYLDSVGADPETTRIFNYFTSGGYVELRGYKVFMDPRPELWNNGISQTGRDYYFEYVDMVQNRTSPATTVNEYDFDYLIVDTKTSLESYLQVDDDYVIVYEGNNYNLWAKTDLLILDNQQPDNL